MSLVKEVLAQLKDICLKVGKPSCYMRIMRITISGHHPLSSIFRIQVFFYVALQLFFTSAKKQTANG